MTAPRVLYLDAYDSFSNNIVTLLEEQLRASVQSIKIDDPRFVLNDDAFHEFLGGFDAAVAGPGPGHPRNATDIGLIVKLWALPEHRTLPVLGICLGFQSLCLSLGGRVERLREPRHGLVTPVTHCNRDVFEGAGEVLATQYHSLNARLGAHEDNAGGLWTPKKALLPLAWDLSDSENGPILMAARHVRKPLWGMQYHPESICTNSEGRKLIRQWWREVCVWKGHIPQLSSNSPAAHEKSARVDSGRTSEDVQARRVLWQSLPIPEGADVVDVVELLRAECKGHEPLLLESGTRSGAPVNAETGRFSIIGMQDASPTHIRYSSGSHRLQITAGEQMLVDRDATVSRVFKCLEEFIVEHKACDGPDGVPFWGGLVGYVSYEAGLETIDVAPAEVSAEHPDVWFVFVEKSIVVDHVSSTLYVQSLVDDNWVTSVTSRLEEHSGTRSSAPSLHGAAVIVGEPIEGEYCANVHECQNQLRAGESYELCLTDTTLVRSDEEAWSMYRRLRHRNPAPFGAYLSFSSTDSSAAELSIASSSPERFLSWSRDGECQFRPIKGTVKKSPGMSREEAEEILRSPKEQAENLMIVDLIRHDLSGVRGVNNVSVPKLMTVEEYTMVYQLVSVITGSCNSAITHPISVLASSLPPGSMTGAPKKRSCELLRSIEGANHKRGIYSGVVGYLDVGGGGDFSVAIRTAFKWGDEDFWQVGAGGAVTVLSEAKAEWEEMRTKRESVLGTFGVHNY